MADGALTEEEVKHETDEYILTHDKPSVRRRRTAWCDHSSMSYTETRRVLGVVTVMVAQRRNWMHLLPVRVLSARWAA